MIFIEDKYMELKEKYTNTIMKTISAFSNYDGGKIVLGVKDNGEVVGIDKSFDFKLSVENSINDSISPRPKYDLEIIKVEDKSILIIKVYKGSDAPYFYKSLSYARRNTSTVPLDKYEMTNLILDSRNMTYDQLESNNKDLEFKYLEKSFQNELGIDRLERDNLISIGLLKDDKYNIAAELFSDNRVPINAYVDIAKFKLSNDIFEDRVYINNKSILEQYNIAMEVFNNYYKPQEVVKRIVRDVVEPVPLVAFREALNNAIIHRDYMVSGGIQIAMYDNRIVITSPGGLPKNITEEAYLSGTVSIPRNQLVSIIFFRLGIIEQFGTGVRRIIESYKGFSMKPKFIFDENYISIILPVVNYDYSYLNDTDGIVAYLSANPNSLRSEIEEVLKIEKTSLVRKLNELVKEGLVIKKGNGPSTNYSAR